ncbi:MAG: OmpA family protein [Cardiobacteriaceae bacterium]|nr:OmpA family protein [Cardiobacteriaceae bacterium]
MKKIAMITATAALALGGCADPNGFQMSDHQRAAIGTAVGALAGGVLGHQVDDDKGRYVGAVAGALAGAAIGNYMDNQQRQLQQQMAGSGVQVQRVDEATIQLNIQSEILFDLDQAVVKPAFYPALNSIAQTLQQYPNTIVHVYGFTDGSGSPQHNQNLSQRRAQSAAQYLASQGVAQNRFVIQGYGERFATAERNPQDRRVAIFIKAIDQNNPNAAYTPMY